MPNQAYPAPVVAAFRLTTNFGCYQIGLTIPPNVPARADKVIK